MMSAPHGQPILIRERGEIVRMRGVHDKPNQRAALFLWTKDASARQFSDAIFAVLITVLVLELRPPERPVFEALLERWPTWLSYAVSYLFTSNRRR